LALQSIARIARQISGGVCFCHFRLPDQSDAQISEAHRKQKGRARARPLFVIAAEDYRSVIARPLQSALASNPTSRPLSSRMAPFWLVSTIAEAPRPTASPAPAAPYTPATSDGRKMLLTRPWSTVFAAPNTMP